MGDQKIPEPDLKLDLASEYARIFENQDVYFEAIEPWARAGRINFGIGIAFFIFAFLLLPLPDNVIIPFGSIRAYFFFGALAIGVILIYPVDSFISKKLRQLENNLGLSNDELLFILAYETNEKLASYFKESNAKRKSYLQASSIKTAKEMVEIVEEWDYGNIGITRLIFGKQLDLLKNNLRRLVLSNMAKGSTSNLKEVFTILTDLCIYILNPSLKKLQDLNVAINKLPYIEYEAQTSFDKFIKELKRRPRTARFLFSSLIVAVELALGYCLSLDMGILFAGAIACFWGAVATFDKIFKFEKG